MQRSPEIGKLAEALAAAQGEMQPVPREKENPFYKSKYADLADIVKTIGPVMSKHGLAVSQWPELDDGLRPVLTTILMHSSGEWLSSSMPLFISKQDPQSLGSATTYGRRYAWSAAVNIATDDDDDGQRATEAARSAPPPQRPTRPRVGKPPAPDQETGEIAPVNESFEERRARILAEARAKGPLQERAEEVQATQRRVRHSPAQQQLGEEA